MRVTLANVREYMKDKGYTPVQVDGIPEGFSFVGPDITIKNILHKGQWWAFIPLADWDNGRVFGDNERELLANYIRIKKQNGK